MKVPGDEFSLVSAFFQFYSFTDQDFCTSVKVPPQHFDPILDYFSLSVVLCLVLLSHSSDDKTPSVYRGLGGRLKGAQTRVGHERILRK